VFGVALFALSFWYSVWCSIVCSLVFLVFLFGVALFEEKRTNNATPNTIPKSQESKQCYTKHYAKKTREQTMLHQTLCQKDKRTNNATSIVCSVFLV
jgi:predicted RND superfamily exporter protein